jgi:hypothetical protein
VYLLIAHFSRVVELPGLVDGRMLLLLLVLLQLSLVLDALLDERVLELLQGKALLLRRRAHRQAHAVEGVVVHRGEGRRWRWWRWWWWQGVCTAGGHKTILGVCCLAFAGSVCEQKELPRKVGG